MQEGLVSVVIPVYNVEKYLDRCVESIVNQTYENLEILLIDDGSPDKSPEICDEWALKDKRIRVFHKENQGAGMARNTGIENAEGEYVCFFDSDDYIEPCTIERSYSLAKRDNSDVVLFGFNSIDKNGKIVSSFIPCDKPEIYVGDEVLNDFLPEYIAPDPFGDGKKKFYMSGWVAIYSMKVIEENNWRYVSEREIRCEDVYSLMDLFSYVKKVSILPEAFYNYCENEVSLSRSYKSGLYEELRNFYIKGVELCEKKGYSKDIVHRVSKPFISITIAVMKSESRVSVDNLKKIIDDDILQKVLKANKKDKVSFTRKVLFWAVRNKFYWLSYILLRLK